MRKTLTTLTAVAACALAPAAANAAIISGEVTGGDTGGVFEKLTPGPGFSVGFNNQDSPNLFGFDELQNVTLTEDMAGIAAGTRVSSHYVFIDPVQGRILGNITFSSPVLGVLSMTPMINASDSAFALSNVNYIKTKNRGLETQFGDSFSFSGNQLTLDFAASTPGDYVRVLTAAGAIPEPATWGMMLLGFAAVGGTLRSRRRNNVKLSYS